MSWIDKVQTDFLITTGDGKEYKVDWVPTSKEVDYNVAEFDFPGVAGTLVQRGQPKGARYDLEVYFQGEENIEQGLDFQQSANDPRPWTIVHPIYGSVTVQPVSLRFDNRAYNITKITGSLIETITQDNPKNTIVPADKIILDNEALNETFANSFVTDVPVPNTNDINTLTANTSSVYNEVKKKISNTLDAEAYFNAFNTANAFILDATAFPLECIQKVQAILNAPFQFADSVKNRVNTLVSQFNKLHNSVENLVRRGDKKIYENNAGVTIAAICSGSVMVPDYKNRNDVVNIIDSITSVYQSYLTGLDSLQSDNGGTVDSYIPNADALIALNDLVNFTLSNLYDIALNSKQERIIFLEDDSNVILLAHRFYGLQADDSTIQQLIDNNNIGLNELLGLRKGREIIYYV